jgi:hypothetical protein
VNRTLGIVQDLALTVARSPPLQIVVSSVYVVPSLCLNLIE